MHPLRTLATAVLLLPHLVAGLFELAALQAWRIRDRMAVHPRH